VDIRAGNSALRKKIGPVIAKKKNVLVWGGERRGKGGRASVPLMKKKKEEKSPLGEPAENFEGYGTKLRAWRRRGGGGLFLDKELLR